MSDRSFIVSEIKRLAKANGGIAVGWRRLETESGIKAHHWGKYWARYGDAVKEAGLSPNAMTEAFTYEELLRYLVALAAEVGHIPTGAELVVRRTHDVEFPSEKVFRRLGSKAEVVAKLAAYCESNGLQDVLEMCRMPVANTDAQRVVGGQTPDGHVYLIKSGKFYKIGFSVHAGARERQLAIQLPEAPATVHVIVTDDPPGIEAYWHRRFADKRKNGEWFALTPQDVAVFKRRKFM